jgi:hypothetical protein
MPTATPTTSPTVTASPTATTPPADAVPMTAVAAASPVGSQAAVFLWRYFDAINRRDYAAYTALLGPQEQGMTPAQFDAGYGSTVDSRETLRGVSTAANGDYVAAVTFTSRQLPSQSQTGTRCTQWDISLYLTPSGTDFLVDRPPASYHAAYAAC